MLQNAKAMNVKRYKCFQNKQEHENVYTITATNLSVVGSGPM
jgi:hypothetical protein